MTAITIEIGGVTEALRRNKALADFLAATHVARIYSRGAISPTGINYAPYVGDRRHQARIHQGRWHTDAEAAAKFSDAAADAVGEAIQQILQDRSPAPPLEAIARKIRDYLIDEPPPLRYIRTGRYVGSWTYEVYVK